MNKIYRGLHSFLLYWLIVSVSFTLSTLIFGNTASIFSFFIVLVFSVVAFIIGYTQENPNE